MKSEVYIFFIYILSGFLIGLTFDFFRVLRKSFKTKDFFTCIEDVLFWFITGIIVIYVTVKFNNGNLRFYTLLGIIFGLTLYSLLFSKLIINLSVCAIKYIKGIIIKLLINPLRSVFKITLKAFKKIISVLKIILSKIGLKRLKIYKKVH